MDLINNDHKNQTHEEKAKEFSLELAEKLRKNEITLTEMVEEIDKFLTKENAV